MTTETEKIKKRELIVGVVFSLILMIIAGRAVHLHVIKSKWLSAKAEAQYKKFLFTSGKRGTIYDINNQELAVSLDVMSIGAFPRKIKNTSSASKKLAKVLDLKSRDIYKKLNSGKSFVWIKRKIPPSDVNSVKELEIKGLEFVPEHNRFYPNKSLAAQILGFTGTDEKGLEGIEYQYNKELAATSDKLIVTKDALGRQFSTTGSNITGFSGNNLTLTIDKRIQFIAEGALKEASEEFDAKYGTAIVMNPKSGALMAVAHYPEFNPNTFGNYSRDLWRNRSVTDPFEPGSTLKVFLAAAAIESNICTPNSIFYCENGTYQIGRNKVNDTHPYQWLSLQQIIKFSSNIGAVKVSEITGKKLLYKTLTDFGFGKKTGIDCPGETPGILLNYNRWSSIDTGAISFGQGISVSSVQLLAAISAIANGGTMVRPHIVKSVTSPDSTLIREFKNPRSRRVISTETAAQVKRIMATVVTDGGTGVNAALNKYTVCGKTGTAQKTNEAGQYSKENYTASFVGFAPQNKPEVAVLVILDEPSINHYGGTVAAPAFRKIVHETLNYMNVPPENNNNEDNVLIAGRYEAKR